MRIISDAIGVPLSIIMPAEIGHTNIQARGDTISEMLTTLKPEPSTEKIELTEEQKSYDPLNDRAIIPWQ